MGLLSRWRQSRARRLAARLAIDDAEWREAAWPYPFFDRLSEEEWNRLRRLAAEFIVSKEWSGAQGLALTRRMQLEIALQACLPILNLGLSWYDEWVGIIIYPGDFVIPRRIIDDDGVVHEYDDTVLGEAWEGGPVLLSWFDDPNATGDVNVVIHEFAHKLDMTNGATDGLPRLHDKMSVRAWREAFAPAYEDFCRRVEAGEETLLDPYAAEHPSEFFAVTSEVFFEAPSLLAEAYPPVYRQLALFYRQDPLAPSAAA
ncbi:MAG: zinc-dependent peptidase [Rhodocyclaceae bacterium]|nr:zinc-dependent peptidase [Rhodocyclaceae bacterium]